MKSERSPTGAPIGQEGGAMRQHNFMRAILILSSFVLESPAFARSGQTSDWSSVKLLDEGDAVVIQARGGAIHAGKLLRANETELWLTSDIGVLRRHLQKEDVLEVRRARTSTGKKVAGAIVGGAAGLLIGPVVGAAIDGDCGGCDDPGLLGAIVGLFAGPPSGAYAGYRISKVNDGKLVYRAPPGRAGLALWESDPEGFSRLLESGAIETGLEPLMQRLETGMLVEVESDLPDR